MMYKVDNDRNIAPVEARERPLFGRKSIGLSTAFQPEAALF